ncbi:MAG: hypothetical protein N3A69_09210 [Leptospiraceae bacterium]|nr:hypothetical protein [Leptospiraceae bacterium]
MKKIFYFLAIFFLTFSCSQKPKLSQEDFFNFFLLNERANRVTLEGRAMKGRVKDALVRVVPLNSMGSGG